MLVGIETGIHLVVSTFVAEEHVGLRHEELSFLVAVVDSQRPAVGIHREGIRVTMFASANTPPLGDNMQIRRNYTAKHSRIVGCSAFGGKVFLADVPF